VRKHFPSALGADDFISRAEIVLSGYGFTGDNSIAMTNLCRDEITLILKDKIEAVFGSSFNTNGLGGVLTCGVTGIRSGLSHSPTSSTGRERYVFFSFPHIAIDSEGNLGAVARPGRAGRSCACGPLQQCLNEFQAEGYRRLCRVPGVHDPLDPEFSILKQRLARRLRYEKVDVTQMDLASLTALAERTITYDLEYLIEKAVEPTAADYAVIAGVQVHNWATSLENDDVPSFEFVAPTKVFVVVEGVKIHLDLSRVPPLSPRQLARLAGNSNKAEQSVRFGVASGAASTLQPIPSTYLNHRLGGSAVRRIAMQPVPVGQGQGLRLPAWEHLITVGAERDVNAPNMDTLGEHEINPSFEVEAASSAATAQGNNNKLFGGLGLLNGNVRQQVNPDAGSAQGATHNGGGNGHSHGNGLGNGQDSLKEQSQDRVSANTAVSEKIYMDRLDG